MGGIIWFSVDDCSTSVYIPLYSTITRVPKTWGHRENDKTLSGDLTRFNFDSAFWVMNMVSNLAYTRWSDIYPEIRGKLGRYEKKFIENVE